MKSLPEFQAYFERELKPALAGMQAKRDAGRPGVWRVWRWWLLAAFALTTVLMILDVAGALARTPKIILVLPFMWGWTLVVLPILLFVRLHRWKRGHQREEKQATLIPAIRFLVPEFTYTPAQHIQPNVVRRSRLFELRGRLGAVSGDDHFAGTIGAGQINTVPVEFSEVSVTTVRVTKSQTVRSKSTGLFLVAELGRQSEHTTLVVPDFRDRLLGTKLGAWLGDAIDFMNEAERMAMEVLRGGTPIGQAPTQGQLGWQTVRLENEAFERQFRVYCTDPDEARRLIGPTVQQRLVEYQARVKAPLALSFNAGALHAFLPGGELFEGNMDADASQFATYQAYHEQLQAVFDLVEIMRPLVKA